MLKDNPQTDHLCLVETTTSIGRVAWEFICKLLDYDIWRIVVNGPRVPTKTFGTQTVPKDENEWDNDDLKLIQINAKAMHNLYYALDHNQFIRIYVCESAKDIWDKLQVVYEATLTKSRSQKLTCLSIAMSYLRRNLMNQLLICLLDLPI